VGKTAPKWNGEEKSMSVRKGPLVGERNLKKQLKAGNILGETTGESHWGKKTGGVGTKREIYFEFKKMVAVGDRKMKHR